MEAFQTNLFKLIKVGGLSLQVSQGSVDLEGIFNEAEQKGVLSAKYIAEIEKIMNSN